MCVAQTNNTMGCPMPSSHHLNWKKNWDDTFFMKIIQNNWIIWIKCLDNKGAIYQFWCMGFGYKLYETK